MSWTPGNDVVMLSFSEPGVRPTAGREGTVDVEAIRVVETTLSASDPEVAKRQLNDEMPAEYVRMEAASVAAGVADCNKG